MIMTNATIVEISREKILDSLIHSKYRQWVDSLPENHQQNLKESYKRNESMTFKAFEVAFKLGYERGIGDNF